MGNKGPGFLLGRLAIVAGTGALLEGFSILSGSAFTNELYRQVKSFVLGGYLLWIA
jgi:hypothetical protein